MVKVFVQILMFFSHRVVFHFLIEGCSGSPYAQS